MITGPIAVGGIGGSGTRVMAALLQELGVYIGSDLPGTLDTIWFAALFGRRNVVLDNDSDFADLAGLFFRQMSNPQPLSEAEVAQLHALNLNERHQHGRDVVTDWTDSFIAHGHTGQAQAHWGWKLPYTYFVIDRLLALRPDLKYVHMTRNGRDMALSRNQNQLGKWGPLLLNRDVQPGPRDALSFWVAVHRYMRRITDRHPGRIYHLSYDRLIRDPDTEVAAVLTFLGAEMSPEKRREFCATIRVPPTVDRHREFGNSIFRDSDLAYLESLPEERPSIIGVDDALEAEIVAGKSSRSGESDRRAYVGPPAQFDFMGATQFRLLTGLGLREEHNVVDIGCGSLRAGRYLLQYLLPDRYTGVEPNTWLWQDALAREIGTDITVIKRPRLLSTDDFSLNGIATDSSDFVVAQSIFSHTSRDLFETASLNAKRVLRPDGQFLFTVVTEDCQGYAQMDRGCDVSGWIYPHCVTFDLAAVHEIAQSAGFFIQPLRWFHPRQKWFRAVLDENLLLTPEMEAELGRSLPLFDERFRKFQ